MIDFRLGAKNRAFSRPRSRNRASITTCSRIARYDDAIGVCCEFYDQGLLGCCARRANVTIFGANFADFGLPGRAGNREKRAQNGQVCPPGATTKKPLTIKLATYADRIVISGYARAHVNRTTRKLPIDPQMSTLRNEVAWQIDWVGREDEEAKAAAAAAAADHK